MNVKHSRFTPGSRSLGRTLATGTMLGATLLMTTPAQAAFHLWNIREVYTDASGTLQFIEFFTSDSSQQFVGGQQISVTPTGGGPGHTFTIPSHLPGDSANHAFLIATAAAGPAGAPTPDYILPDNFLFLGGGTISFFGANGGIYTTLPTDGVFSRTWGDGDSPNNPQNFADEFGIVVVPEPASLGLLFALGALGLGFLTRRRAV